MTLARSMTPEHLLQDLGKRLRHLRQARKLRQLDMEDFGRLCTKNDTLSGLLVQDAILHQKSSCIYAITSVFCPRLFSNIGSIPSS